MSTDVVIYHNPACGTSRNTLAMIRNAGIEPHVVEYLKTPPSRAMLVQLIERAGITPRQLLREKGTPYGELGLDDEALSDAALVDAMIEHPILINRPLVATTLGVRLCRPSEAVLDILLEPQRGAFAKEGRRAGGRRLRPPHERRMIRRSLLAEALGSLILFATVIGSGIMAERLAGGNVAVALLGNTLATGAILFVLVTMLGPISGAHLNPAVTLVMRLRGHVSTKVALGYVAAQLIGGVLGIWLAHVMFDVPVLQLSTKIRSGPGQLTGEAAATFGLVLTILGTARVRPSATPTSVALFITAAYWFTSSTSFANPAITIARSLSDSFAGIAPASVPGFIAAQLVGALVAHLVADLIFTPPALEAQ